MILQRNSKVYLFFNRSFVILCLLLAIPFLTSCEKNRMIVNGLEEKEANEIIVLLSTKGIDAQKVKNQESGAGGGQKMTLWDISVPQNETTQAMSVLNNAGFPRKKPQNLLNIFSNTGLVPTDMAEKIRYQAGLASQMASTIRNIDGVLDADVLISFPEQDPLNPTAPKKDITASVYVKHSGVLDDPNTHLVSKIKNLVTSGVSGLKYENVTLVPDRARFTDLPQGGITRSDEDTQFVRLWTIAVGKDSVTTFRFLFLSFCLTILFLVIAISWLIWKIYPILKDHGGIRQLLNLKAMTISEKKVDEEVESQNLEKKQKQKTSKQIDSLADESADFGGDLDVYDEDEEK